MCAQNSIITIDLKAVQANYTMLDSITEHACVTACSIKANAYGLGAEQVAKSLWLSGARTFFVATIDEAIALRAILNEAYILMLHGYQDEKESQELYVKLNIIPVLNSLLQIKNYEQLARTTEKKLPAVLHFDTGMNRLGLGSDETQILLQNPDKLSALDIKLVMSHFSSSDEKESPLNEQQFKKFQAIYHNFPGIARSLCNSSGIFRSEQYHLDLTRPGMALYGLNPTPETANPMKPVVSAYAPIVQIKKADKTSTAGYNASYRFAKDTYLAVVSVGYADGLLRTLGNKGALYWKGIALPIRGRVSMDLVICDLCDLAEKNFPKTGDLLEVIGPSQSADDLARAAGTIGYEILTSLGQRYKRIYT